MPAPSRLHVRMRHMLLALLVCAATSASYAEDDFPVPDGYVLQRLEASDGKIVMPKDWYYHSSGTPSGWLYTFSAEDPAKSGGEYETGLRIQLLVGVAKGTKQPTEAFAQKFLEKKRLTTKVLKDCEPVPVGEFNRQCLEVIETIPNGDVAQTFHVLYSVFWGTDLDMVIVTTFGAPQDKWESVRSICDAMSHFELIGPNLGKATSSQP